MKNKFLLIAALLLTPSHENSPSGEELIASAAPLLVTIPLPAIAYIGMVGFIAYASCNYIEGLFNEAQIELQKKYAAKSKQNNTKSFSQLSVFPNQAIDFSHLQLNSYYDNYGNEWFQLLAQQGESSFTSDWFKVDCLSGSFVVFDKNLKPYDRLNNSSNNSGNHQGSGSAGGAPGGMPPEDPDDKDKNKDKNKKTDKDKSEKSSTGQNRNSSGKVQSKGIASVSNALKKKNHICPEVKGLIEKVAELEKNIDLAMMHDWSKKSQQFLVLAINYINNRPESTYLAGICLFSYVINTAFSIAIAPYTLCSNLITFISLMINSLTKDNPYSPLNPSLKHRQSVVIYSDTEGL